MKAFLSSSKDDLAVADQFRAALETVGIRTLVAKQSPRPGEDWRESIREVVAEADVLIFLVSSAAANKAPVQLEWSTALEISWDWPDKPIIPVVLGTVNLPGFLRTRQAVHVSQVGDVTLAAQTVAKALKSKTPAAATDANSLKAGPDDVERQIRLEVISKEADQTAPTPDSILQEVRHLEMRITDLATLAPNALELAELHVRCADAQKALAHDELALPHLDRAVEILASHPEAQRRYARILLNRAAVLGRLKRYREARHDWMYVRDLYKTLDGDASLIAAIARINLISLHLILLDTNAARQELSGLGDDASNFVRLALPAVIEALPAFAVSLLMTFLNNSDGTSKLSQTVADGTAKQDPPMTSGQ